MTRRRCARLGAFCLALVISLSLVLVTTSRRAALAASLETDVAYAQFLAIGGAFDDLCKDGGISHPGSTACDACHLTNLVALPPFVAPPPSIATTALAFLAAPATLAPRAALSNPAAPVRGPPMRA